jgi:hypothetical protein
MLPVCVVKDILLEKKYPAMMIGFQVDIFQVAILGDECSLAG